MNDFERLQDAIDLVVFERREAERLSGLVKARRDAFEAEIAGMVEQAKNAATAASDAADGLREMALKAYAANGEKHVAHGVEIKEFLVLRYDNDEATRWALEHRLCLSLDRKAFEATAKATPHSFPFVEIVTEPRAQLATDLAMAKREEVTA